MQSSGTVDGTYACTAFAFIANNHKLSDPGDHKLKLITKKCIENVLKIIHFLNNNISIEHKLRLISTMARDLKSLKISAYKHRYKHSNTVKCHS